MRIIDSHTGGEPTRVVVTGGPDLGSGFLSERLERFRVEHDDFRSAVVNEPRGSDVMVGALLCEPTDPKCAAGVIFFNNVGYLGMCGHGTIGLVVTLAHIGRIGVGMHHIETPVGTVQAQLHENGEVTVNNVASYRSAANLALDVKAPAGIQAVFGRKDNGATHVLSLVNLYGGLATSGGPPMHPQVGPVEVSIPVRVFPARPKAVRPIDAHGVKWKISGNALEVQIASIGHHALLVMT